MCLPATSLMSAINVSCFGPHVPVRVWDKTSLLLLLEAMMEADRDREMVDVIVKKIEAEEKAEQEQYLRSRYV